jgi:hypothetical protein
MKKSNKLQNKLLNITPYVLTILIFAFLLTGCDFMDIDEVYKPKTRIALFNISLEKFVVSHPDYPDETLCRMIAIEDGTDEPVTIYTIDGFTYEEGYRYKIKMKIITHPRIGDMILTGQRKRDWGNITPLEFSNSYELIVVLSKIKVDG